jgi:MarR family transcriptional regulator, transcriptional regulator for hemolysin
MAGKLLQNIGSQIKITANIMSSEHNKYLNEYDISSEQGMLLKFVYDFPGSTQTQLAELLYKDKTTITRMIDVLEKKGRVYREVSQKDRRVYNIYLTETTKQEVEAIAPVFEKIDRELREMVSEKEYENTIEVLKKIQEYYRRLNK